MKRLTDLFKRKPKVDLRPSCAYGGCNNKGTKGSLQHPYCPKHFTELFNDDYNRYFDWLKRSHYLE